MPNIVLKCCNMATSEQLALEFVLVLKSIGFIQWRSDGESIIIPHHYICYLAAKVLSLLQIFPGRKNAFVGVNFGVK